MSGTVLFLLRMLALSLVVCATAGAAQPTHLAQNDLYLDAIQSIADGKENEASDALTRMIEQEPQHAGAWLDLAIIQCELGHAKEAERLFLVIETRFSPPPGILEVIAVHRASGCKGWQPHSQISVTLSRGVDSNVNQGASSPNFSIGSGSSRLDLELLPEYLPQHDQYTLLSTDYTRDLSRYGGTGFVQFRVRQNDSLSRYNTASLLFGMEQQRRVGNWGVRGIGSLGLLTLGNQLYQRQGQLQTRISPPLALQERLQLSLLAGITHIEYTTLSNFDSNTMELSGLLTYRGDKTQTQASVGYIADRGEAGRLGGNRTGWFASAQGNFGIIDNIGGELGWSHQSWLSQSAYSPGLIDQTRHQDTQLLRAALIIPVKTGHSVHIEFRHVRNDENISIFQYNSRLLQVSWQWKNF